MVRTCKVKSNTASTISRRRKDLQASYQYASLDAKYNAKFFGDGNVHRSVATFIKLNSNIGTYHNDICNSAAGRKKKIAFFSKYCPILHINGTPGTGKTTIVIDNIINNTNTQLTRVDMTTFTTVEEFQAVVEPVLFGQNVLERKTRAILLLENIDCFSDDASKHMAMKNALFSIILRLSGLTTTTKNGEYRMLSNVKAHKYALLIMTSSKSYSPFVNGMCKAVRVRVMQVFAVCTKQVLSSITLVKTLKLPPVNLYNAIKFVKYVCTHEQQMDIVKKRDIELKTIVLKTKTDQVRIGNGDLINMRHVLSNLQQYISFGENNRRDVDGDDSHAEKSPFEITRCIANCKKETIATTRSIIANNDNLLLADQIYLGRVVHDTCIGHAKTLEDMATYADNCSVLDTLVHHIPTGVTDEFAVSIIHGTNRTPNCRAICPAKGVMGTERIHLLKMQAGARHIQSCLARDPYKASIDIADEYVIAVYYGKNQIKYPDDGCVLSNIAYCKNEPCMLDPKEYKSSKNAIDEFCKFLTPEKWRQNGIEDKDNVEIDED